MSPLLGANPLSPAFQALLQALGAVLAWMYSIIPNYGVAIIVLTLAIRIALLPLGLKQIRSMQAMQVMQPKVKALQQKYKGDKERLREEQMKLYRESGVNPLGGCLPMLGQIPVLIALFAVLNVPKGLPHVQGNAARPTGLYQDILHQAPGIRFVGANLVCSAAEAGRQVTLPQSADAPEFRSKDCGAGGAIRIPYYVLLALMIGTTFYQQRQMQRATPGPANQQQQILTRVMPLFFGFIGYTFPSGLVLYWTTTNVVQIAQQHYMLRERTAGPEAEGPGGDGDRPARAAGGGGKPGGAGGAKGTRPRGVEGLRGRPGAGGQGRGQGGSGPKKGSGGASGGRGGGSRKKRRKR